MVSIIFLTSVLKCDEDVMKFDNVQELLQWHNRQSQTTNVADENFEDNEVTIVKIGEKKELKHNSINNKASSFIMDDELVDYRELESVPDATVVQVDSDNAEIVEEQSKEFLSVNSSCSVDEKIVEENIKVIEPVKIKSQNIVKENDLLDEVKAQPLVEKRVKVDEVVQKSNTIEPVKVETKTSLKEIVKDEEKDKPITIIKYTNTYKNQNLESLSSTCDSFKGENIDFWKLLDIALIKSTAVILKKHDIEISQKMKEIVKSEYYPTISLGYNLEYYHGYGHDGSSIGGSYYPGYSQYRDSLNLDLRHELYRFGATDLKMQMSQKDVEIIESELELAKQDISKELLSYFMEAVRAQENLKFKDDMRIILDRIVQKKERLYEAGQLSKVAVLRDQLSLVTLEKEILIYERRYIDNLKKIQILANIELDPKSVKLTIPTPKNKEIVRFEDSAVAKNLKLNMEKKLQELELIKKDYKPTIYANSSYLIYGDDDDSFTKAIANLSKNNWDAGVSFRWDLFSGFKTDASVEKTKIEVQKLVDQYRLAKVDFESRKAKREMLKGAIEKILRVEAQILEQTCHQNDLLVRLENAGQISSLEIDNVEISKLRSELEFRLGVIDSVYETISDELII